MGFVTGTPSAADQRGPAPTHPPASSECPAAAETLLSSPVLQRAQPLVQIETKQGTQRPSKTGFQLGEVREFELGGDRYVFVIPTTALYRVDRVAGEILRLLRPEGASWPDHTQALQVPETRSLKVSEIVSSLYPGFSREQVLKSLAELRAIGASVWLGPEATLPGPSPPTLPPVPFPVRSLVLNIANDCNLGCTYCFASQGNYGAPKRLMSEETARESVDFLLRASGDHESVTLVFFGGEPLMNFRLIKSAVDYATQAGARAGKRVEFTMTTNATYLTTEVIQFLNDHAIGVSVSIDGPKKFHDLRRTFKNGKGSYEFIEPRVASLIRNHKTRPLAARVTLTHGVTAVREIFHHLITMGFHEVGFSPVTSSDQDDYALTSDELWTVLTEFKGLADSYVEKAARDEYLGFSNLSNALYDLHSGVVKAYPCGAGLGLVGVGSTGDLYLCHRFLESERHQIGTLDAGVDPEKQSAFLAETHISRKPPCQVCWVRNLCAGGCHHEAYTRYGVLGHANTHYCEWIRSWIDLALKSYVAIQERNPDFLYGRIDRRGA